MIQKNLLKVICLVTVVLYGAYGQEINENPVLIRMRDKSTCRDARDEVVALGAAAVPELINIVLSKKNDTLPRIDSMWVLFKIRDIRALPVALSIADDSSEDCNLRSAACLVIGAMGNEYSPAALSRALDDGDTYVRSCAVGAIGDIGKMEGLPFLEELQKVESDKTVLYHIREAKAKILTANAVDKAAVLAGLLDLKVRWVVEELKRVGDAGALSALEAYKGSLSESWEYELFPQAILTIEDRILDSNALCSKDRIHALVRELDNRYRPRNPTECPYDLILHLGNSAVPLLVDFLGKGVEPDISSELAGFESYRTNGEARTQLIASKISTIRVNIAWVLGEIGDQRAVPVLIDMLLDADRCSTYGGNYYKNRMQHWDGFEYLRGTAAESLGKMGAVSALSALETAINVEKDESVRERLGKVVETLRKHVRKDK